VTLVDLVSFGSIPLSPEVSRFAIVVSPLDAVKTLDLNLVHLISNRVVTISC